MTQLFQIQRIMQCEYRLSEPNLRRAAKSEKGLIRQEPELDETDKQNTPDNYGVPENPLNKKLFLKKSRKQPFKEAESETKSNLRAEIVDLLKQQQNVQKQTTEYPLQVRHQTKRNLKDYILEEQLEKQISRNNRVFGEILEHLLKIKQEINEEIRDQYSQSERMSFHKSLLARDNTKKNLYEDESEQKVIENVISFLDRVFRRVSENTQKTNHQFQAHRMRYEQEYSRQQPYENSPHKIQNYVQYKSEQVEKGINYFKRTPHVSVGNYKTNEDSKKESRISNFSGDNKNMKKNSEKTTNETGNKKTSVYQKVLEQRRLKAKKL